MTFPTTSVLDNFDRASLGANWVNSWFGDGDFLLSSNHLVNAASGWAGAYYSAAQFGPDCEQYITLITQTDVQFKQFLRIGGPDITYQPDGYSVVWNANGKGQHEIERWDDGSLSTLANFSGDLAAGDVVGVQMIGNNLTAYRNGVSMASATDSTYSSAGYFALELETVTGWQADNWGGGTVGAASPAFAYQHKLNTLLRM